MNSRKLRNFIQIFTILLIFSLFQQCEESTKSPRDPEIIFSNPYFTITSLDSNKIEYNIDLEYMITAKHCIVSTLLIKLNEINIQQIYDGGSELEPMKKYPLFGKFVIDESHFHSLPLVTLTLYDRKTGEKIIGECTITEKEK